MKGDRKVHKSAKRSEDVHCRSHQTVIQYKCEKPARAETSLMKKEIPEMVQLFESIMMIVFGLSWPVNIAKSLRSRTTLGKSIGYEYMVMLGYTCGVIAKLISW